MDGSWKVPGPGGLTDLFVQALDSDPVCFLLYKNEPPACALDLSHRYDALGVFHHHSRPDRVI